jgi:hypothetical protein
VVKGRQYPTDNFKNLGSHKDFVGELATMDWAKTPILL